MSRRGRGRSGLPELGLTGYSLDDLVLADPLLDAVEVALGELVSASTQLLPVLVVGAPLRARGRVYNCAVVVHRGQILGVTPKSYLPTYREFYESRTIAAGDDVRGTIRVGLGPGEPVGTAQPVEVPFGPDLLFRAVDVPDLVVHVEVCEDMWVPIPLG